MILHPLASRLVSGIALVLALVGLMLVPAPAPVAAEELSREEQIAQIERQIAELQQKLEALKKAPAPSPRPTVPEPTLPAEWTKALTWRCIGPASMGGRIVALAVNESDPTMYWVATASGGLLKTVNNGVTFEHQFDHESTVSIGDVAVAPSNPNIIWVGTGEHNPRNSVSYGDGVYKSTDGGKKWTNMGLKKSFQIGRIVIHPTNPDIVYVGALGRLYGPNEERGLYKTTDGGKSWKKILHVDNNTGVIEIKMHPTNPDTILVATWERRRDGFDSHAGALAAGSQAKVNPPLEEGYDAYDPIRKWGKGSGIWKTTDGEHFTRVTRGLPSGQLGRIGLDFYRKDPNIVYAVIDCDKIGLGRVPGYLGVTPENGKGGARIDAVTDDSPAKAAGVKAGDIVTAIDGKPVKDAAGITRIIQGHKPGDKVTLSVTREKEKPLTINVTLSERPEVIAARRLRLDFKPEDTPAGVRVQALFPQGPSARAGLKINDVITNVDKQKITSSKQLIDAYRSAQPGSKMVLKVQRGKETRDLVVLVPEPRRLPRPYALRYGGQRENVQDVQGPDGHEYGGIYRSADAGTTWTRVNSVNPRPMYFSQIRVDPTDEKRIYVLGVRLYRSEDGGKTFNLGGDAGVHPDHHAMWINPRDSRHILIGTDGGTYVSYDRCQKWDFLNTMAIGQFYHVTVDTRRPYRVYGGMQDNGSWGGPSRSLDGRGPINADWFMVQGGDGYVCRVDPSDPDLVYTEMQDGGMRRTDLRTGRQVVIKPSAPAGKPPYRFNWNTPFILSSHNPKIHYSAGNFVFRSYKRGDDPRVISPELTRSDQASATALAESPRNPDVLWAGTDDGNLWVTRDGGGNWTNVASKVGLPKPYYVATIEASRFVEGRCYVCFDAHRSDNDDPHLYRTEDYGQTWTAIRGNLPMGSSRVLREDLFNPDVLYLGTEFAVWASIDRGNTWTKINNNLPTVAVHELAQHPTAGEMVAATHGRSLWVLDVTPLRQLKPNVAKAPATLLAPNTVIRWRRELTRGTIYGMGNRDYFGENPPSGAHIYYVLTAKAKSVKLEVQDFAGETVANLQVKNEPGLHRTTWNLIARGATATGLESFLPSGLRRARSGSRQAPAGQYRVVLTVDGKTHSQGLRIENDPTLPTGTTIAEPEELKQRDLRPDD